MTNNNLGLYIHIPFCVKKCNYCDFYSVVPTEDIRKRYIESLVKEIKKWVDEEYAGGRVTVLTDDEILAELDKVCKQLGVVVG